MSDIVIRVEGLSKQYRIGALRQRHDSIREALVAGLSALPRRLRRGGTSTEVETIWALKDVSFEVQRGEVVGIPSLRQAQYKRRAQDKHWAQRGGEDHAYFDRLSTRLKILSRITEPTEGYAETSS